MITIGYFLISVGIFLVFSALISLMGYFFQYRLFSKFKSKKISLTILLESFGIGTVLFIFYSYLVIDFLRAFNFLTIYLPLIIFDSVNLIFLIFNNKLYLRENYTRFISKFQKWLSNKQIKRHIGILIVIFTLLLLVQGVIETRLNLPSKDPYTWLNISLYLRKYGDLNYDNYSVHGVGFAIFVSGSLLITENFFIQYFFIKYIPIFFFSIIILAVYNIATFFFKRDIEVLITLIVLLCFNSLLIRFSLAVPSIVATTLGIIFFSTLIQKYDLRIQIVRGILLGGMILSHPLYFVLIYGYLILFELLLLIHFLRVKIKTSDIQIRDKLVMFVKKNGILLLISLILTIPYFLNLVISEKSLYRNFTRYLYRGYDANINISFSELLLSIITRTILIDLSPSRTNFLYNLLFFGLNIPINKTLSWGFVFIILGLFYKVKGGEQKEYLIELSKFTFIFTFLIFIVNSFLFVIDNNTILSIASFINQYGKRTFELFAPIWSFLIVYGVLFLFKKIKIKKGVILNNKDKIRDIEQKLEKYYTIILIIIGVSLYSSHLYFQYNLLYTSHYDDDDLTEALLFIGDYFNEKDLEDKTVIFPDNFDSKVIYQMIYHRDIEREYLEFDHTNYTELMNETNKENADFVLVYKLEAKDSCLDKIDDNQKVLYENSNFLFFKVK